MPVFVANGDSDPMILPHYSYLLAGLIPHARVKIYPDAAHGFLFSITPSSPPTSRHSSPSATDRTSVSVQVIQYQHLRRYESAPCRRPAPCS